MKKPNFLTKPTRDKLSWKEQDFIAMLYQKRYTKKQLMRKLYIETYQGYWKLRKRVEKKIKDDINKVYKD